MQEVGFEPTPPKRLVPETSALDHSATLAYTVLFFLLPPSLYFVLVVLSFLLSFFLHFLLPFVNLFPSFLIPVFTLFLFLPSLSSFFSFYLRFFFYFDAHLRFILYFVLHKKGFAGNRTRATRTQSGYFTT